jgi:hypothetical protein
LARPRTRIRAGDARPAPDEPEDAVTDLNEIIANWREDGTPGPWRLVPASEMGDRCTIYFDEVWSDGTEILVASEVTRAHCDGGRASLRLIAAAPDMADRIEALEAENARLREHAVNLHDVLAMAANGDVEQLEWLEAARTALSASRRILEGGKT